MSETTAALLILPSLAALVLVLECSRVGCTRLSRRWARPRPAGTPLSIDARGPHPLPDQIAHF